MVQHYGEKCFLYDVVANGRNGIDVDKYDFDHYKQYSYLSWLCLEWIFVVPENQSFFVKIFKNYKPQFLIVNIEIGKWK